MTQAHYDHIQSLIRRELGGRFESSGWFAGGLASLGVAVTILITIWSTELHNAAHRGKLEVAGWFFLVIALGCGLVHFFGSRRTGKQRAQDLVDMMDRYNLEMGERTPGPGRAPAPTDAGPAASPPAA
ncbi:MAG TPA: hypothetical protein VG053_05570 [Solirubrobacteraceae bacterium]|jgi:hypothetical protein|nr:hypothetical protein [Solirubrobacteraceae bacterium]